MFFPRRVVVIDLVQDGSLVVFKFGDPFGEEDAKDLCARFAAGPECPTAICTVAGDFFTYSGQAWGRCSVGANI